MKDFFSKLAVLSICFGVVLTISMFVVAQVALADTAQPPEGEKPAVQSPEDTALKQTMVIAIAFMVGVGSLAAAYAVGKIGAASMGAASERPELLGRALIFVGLAEGIAIYGLLVGILLLLLKM